MCQCEKANDVSEKRKTVHSDSLEERKSEDNQFKKKRTRRDRETANKEETTKQDLRGP